MEKTRQKLQKARGPITYANLSAQKIKIKKDKHFRKRGGTTKIITVSCKACGNLLFVYQKDGPGWLKRCYLNRILFPEEYASLQKNKLLKIPKDLGNLKCSCGSLIGTPIQHKDSRLAFKLVRKSFKRKTPKKLNYSLSRLS
ncbi:hypothetical protein KA107_02080 [Candidatus Pacearchaeota archaeon]|nr:hypothetical protein [Candidatus Pacearchaeota archaeon]